jgi:GMP synthase-like glutamine amidotransferase
MSSDLNGFKVLILQHEEPSPGGFIYDWASARGAEVEMVRMDLDPPEVDPNGYDVLIPLGSEFAAYDDSLPWLAGEIKLLERAIADDVPIFGICFGGQLLARVLGGRCFRSEIPEIGWLSVGSDNTDLVPDGPWFQWHFDTFEAPPGSDVIARTAVGPEAFVIGRNMGVQFHPEVTPKIMDEWVSVFRHELDDSGVDPDKILEDTHKGAESAAGRSSYLLDSYIREIHKWPEKAKR